VEVLGEEDGRWAADLLTVTATGTFEHGSSVLRLARDVDDADAAVVQRWAQVRRTLLDARTRRPQPALDDKVVASWNGLMIVALAEFARVALTLDPVDGSEWAQELLAGGRLAASMASGAGTVLADRHLVDGRLRRVSRLGMVGEPAGVLEDYGCVADAFCALHQATGEARWLELAGGLLDTALEHFSDGEGGFFDTADDAEQLVTRPADPTDNATPSGLSSMVSALLSFSALTGESRYHEAAERALGTVVPLLAGHARFAGFSAAGAEALVGGPMEIAIVTADGWDDPLVRSAITLAPAGAVIVAGSPDQPGVPLLAGRPMIGGRSTAYVCRGFVCDRPVTTTVDLATILGSYHYMNG
jgi:uncharacterized protein YyaL (SSP411 family)